MHADQNTTNWIVLSACICVHLRPDRALRPLRPSLRLCVSALVLVVLVAEPLDHYDPPPMSDAPDFRMDGRVALITGAGRGIGLAIARAFVAQGAAVAIQDVDEDVAAAEVEKIRGAGGRAVALGGDVTDASIAARLVDDTVRE